MSNLSIIIPIFFNKIELYQTIDKCIESVKKYYPNEELITIDDCSPIDNDWCVYRNGKNLGWTQTVNFGLHIAHNDKIVVMNDDILLKEGDLDRFYTIEYGIYSPKTTDEGEGDRFGSIWGLTKETYRTLGPLNQGLKHFFSDAEYYDRAKKKNIPITKWDNVVEHLGGKTYETINKEELYNADFDIYRKTTS